MYNKYYDEAKYIADLINIKLAPIEQMLSVYPDEFLGSQFSDEVDSGAINARNKYSIKTQNALIKAFRSHYWKRTSDIYGHNGLSWGGHCKTCKRKVKLPETSFYKEDWSDDFILAFHYIYGSQKRFGGRITKCYMKK